MILHSLFPPTPEYQMGFGSLYLTIHMGRCVDATDYIYSTSYCSHEKMTNDEFITSKCWTFLHSHQTDDKHMLDETHICRRTISVKLRFSTLDVIVTPPLQVILHAIAIDGQIIIAGRFLAKITKGYISV